MNELPRTPSLTQVISNAITGRLADVHTAIPAKVERYDATKQLVDATPLIKASHPLEDGEIETQALPTISNVPVVFPGGGGFRLTFPIQVGDTVLLVFSEASLDKWLQQGGTVDPLDTRRHHLADAIAIPGLHPFSAPSSGADTSVITIGSDSGSDDFAATAQRVLTELNKIKTAFDSHTHILTIGGVTPGVGAGTGTAAPPVAGITGLTAPASATVKVRG